MPAFFRYRAYSNSFGIKNTPDNMAAATWNTGERLRATGPVLIYEYVSVLKLFRMLVRRAHMVWTRLKVNPIEEKHTVICQGSYI